MHKGPIKDLCDVTTSPETINRSLTKGRVSFHRNVTSSYISVFRSVKGLYIVQIQERSVYLPSHRRTIPLYIMNKRFQLVVKTK